MLPQDHEVLNLVVEDYYGLWEVIWRLDTVFGDTLGPTLEVARASVERLQNRGLVTVCIREGLDDEPIPIDKIKRSIDLSKVATWSEPYPGRPQVVLTATEQGEIAILGPA